MGVVTHAAPPTSHLWGPPTSTLSVGANMNEASSDHGVVLIQSSLLNELQVKLREDFPKSGLVSQIILLYSQ